jgi:hypothetical protein
MHSMYRGRVSHHHRGAMMTTPARSTFGAAGRTYGGQRNRFVLGTTAEGASEVTLGDGEVATVTVDAEGNTVVTIENKPAAENGNGNGVAMPVEASRNLIGRLTNGIRQKMSWQREGDGTITFTPDEGEALDVDGDSLLAVVTAIPVPAG